MLNQLPHVFRFRLNGRQRFRKRLRILRAPTNQQIRIPVDHRNRRTQLMRRVADELPLLRDPVLDTIERAVNRHRQFILFVA